MSVAMAGSPRPSFRLHVLKSLALSEQTYLKPYCRLLVGSLDKTTQQRLLVTGLSSAPNNRMMSSFTGRALPHPSMSDPSLTMLEVLGATFTLLNLQHVQICRALAVSCRHFS